MTATPYIKKAPFRTVGIGKGKVAGSEAMAEAPLAEQGALAGQVESMGDADVAVRGCGEGWARGFVGCVSPFIT